MNEGFRVVFHKFIVSPFNSNNFTGNIIEVRVSIMYDGKEIIIPFNGGYKKEHNYISPEICVSHAYFGDLNDIFLNSYELNYGDIKNYDFTRLIYNQINVILNTAVFSRSAMFSV